ncbi:hypothetical protein TRFO_33219 [Tritrichomonas foetus]|uniref:Ubiquitin-related modifier 1 n=1 Tax=Tritrichomonas foetus TaxID=1144522 RepID=A0A1J4JNB1_9EUKA|nr:hypothetical protein TRFO_33219 [Tritrichomonas foetus]|eukprot:OHT00186.1 hypothetical protein TRFO_33219 [Tritrichomonas foetus]
MPSILAQKYIDPNHPIRFVDDKGQVVAGILIMLNDTDSEIEGLDKVLCQKDIITFISTLHGG